MKLESFVSWSLRQAENPQFQKRVREYVRGQRAFWVMGIYTGVLAVICLSVLSRGIGPGKETSVAGREIFITLGIVQAIFIAVVSLSLAQWSMVAERTSRCFPLLVLTGMTPLRILAGEIMANLAFAAGLVIIGMPMMGLSFFLGGASMGEIVTVGLLCIAGAFLVSCLGLFGSVVSEGGNLVSVLLRGLFATLAVGFVIFLYIIWLAANQNDVGNALWLQKMDGPFSLYGTLIPGMLFSALLAVLLVFLLLNVACRKFYDSTRRAFSAPVFALSVAILLVLLAGSSYSGGRASEGVYFPFNLTASGVLLVGVLFAAGRDQDEVLCPRRRGRIERLAARFRIHLVGLLVVIMEINHVWRWDGSFDVHAQRRLFFYLVGLLLAAQGMVNLMGPLIPIRRALVFVLLAVFIIWSTVVPFAGVMMAEESFRFSPNVTLLGIHLFASSPITGVIAAIDPAELPSGIRGRYHLESWLWLSVACIHGLMFLLATVSGTIAARTKKSKSRRKAMVPQRMDGD